jgi:HEAT repeat protein
VAACLVLAASLVAAQDTAKPPEFTAQDKQEMDALMAHFENERTMPVFEAAGWTMMHVASEDARKRVDPLFGALQEYRKGNAAPVLALGGAKGLVKEFRNLLADPDPVMRAFAAILLAVIDDRESKTEIAKLLKPRPAPAVPAPGEEPDALVRQFDRGRAAIALGLMGAGEYAKDISPLLASDDAIVRSGAALGLGYMGDKTCVKEIAALLKDKDDEVQNCAERALAMLDAREYAKDIASLLVARGDPSVHETACFALAKLRAKDQVPEIAKLLQDEFGRQKASKALAVMGAGDYTNDIAAILGSDEPLSRCAALVSLGILNAKATEDAVAEHLKDKEEFVRPYAALALVLMGSRKYAREAVAGVGEEIDNLLTYHEFDPLVMDDLRKIRDRARANLKEMQAGLAK